MSNEKQLDVVIKGLNSTQCVTLAAQFIDNEIPQGNVNVAAPMSIGQPKSRNHYRISVTVDPPQYSDRNATRRYQDSVVLMVMNRNTPPSTHIEYLKRWQDIEAVNSQLVTVIPIFVNHDAQNQYLLGEQNIQWLCEHFFNSAAPVYCDVRELDSVYKVFDQATERFEQNAQSRRTQIQINQGRAKLQVTYLKAASEALKQYPGYKENHSKTGSATFKHTRNLTTRFALKLIDDCHAKHSLDKFRHTSKLLLCMYLAQPISSSNKFHTYLENALVRLAGDMEEINQKLSLERNSDRSIDNATRLIADTLGIGYLLNEKQRSDEDNLLIKLFALMAKKEMAGSRGNKINRQLKQIYGVIEHVADKGMDGVSEKLKAMEEEVKGHSRQLREVVKGI